MGGSNNVGTKRREPCTKFLRFPSRTGRARAFTGRKKTFQRSFSPQETPGIVRTFSAERRQGPSPRSVTSGNKGILRTWEWRGTLPGQISGEIPTINPTLGSPSVAQKGPKGPPSRGGNWAKKDAPRADLVESQRRSARVSRESLRSIGALGPLLLANDRVKRGDRVPAR